TTENKNVNEVNEDEKLRGDTNLLQFDPKVTNFSTISQAPETPNNSSKQYTLLGESIIQLKDKIQALIDGKVIYPS
ncbi:hypothetical protein HAX54_041686, partial [Datura stramonium]|nr:hypothetical protein [Datura stramonium]